MNYNKERVSKLIKKSFKGFTLIELLVAIAIIGVLMAISIFSLSQSRAAARDARRKADLELIRSGIELYKADCNGYPTSAITSGTQLKGSGSPTSCAVANVYINSIPTDPSGSGRSYSYNSDGITYNLCAALEKAPNPAMDTTLCSSCTAGCNYIVNNP